MTSPGSTAALMRRRRSFTVPDESSAAELEDAGRRARRRGALVVAAKLTALRTRRGTQRGRAACATAARRGPAGLGLGSPTSWSRCCARRSVSNRVRSNPGACDLDRGDGRPANARGRNASHRADRRSLDAAPAFQARLSPSAPAAPSVVRGFRSVGGVRSSAGNATPTAG